MNLNRLLLIGITMVAVILISCNPECDTATLGNISIDSGEAILQDRENEMLVRSNPPNFVQGRKFFIDDPVDGNRIEVESRFESMLRGVVVTIPPSAASTPNLYVEDPDCSGDVILIDQVQIRSQDFFYFSDLFVVPPIPIVVIPIPAVAPPPLITNAWITPYERSYCIWFVPELDDNGAELNQLREYIPGVDEQKASQDPSFMLGSHEFVVCGNAERHSNADKNPVSGFVDKEANVIEIQVDRTAKGLGVEYFSGIFINPQSIPNTEDWRNGGPCDLDPQKSDRSEFMLLTSQSTGQQVLMLKALNL